MIMTHVDEVWPQILDLLLRSPRVDGKQGELRELIGGHVVLDGLAEQFSLHPRRRLSPIYASAELLWYLSREKSARMIRAYAPQYEKFIEEDGTAFGAYGHRIRTNCIYHDLLDGVIKLLQERPTSKKAVIALWKPGDLAEAVINEMRDIPCTLTWQFLKRGNKLHMICNMRSCDAWIGLLYDCYVNTVIQRYVACCVGCIAGEYHHVCGSLHLYEKNVQAAKEAAEVSFIRSEPFFPQPWWNDDELQLAVKMEREIREWNKYGAVISDDILPSVLRDAVLCCKANFSHEYDDEICSPGLRTALHQYLASKGKE